MPVNFALCMLRSWRELISPMELGIVELSLTSPKSTYSRLVSRPISEGKLPVKAVSYITRYCKDESRPMVEGRVPVIGHVSRSK